MKKLSLLLCLSALLVSCGGNTPSPDGSNNQSEDSEVEPTPTPTPDTEPDPNIEESNPEDPEEEDESRIDHITLSNSELILSYNEKYSLFVNFFPTVEGDDISDVYDGEWTTSDPSIATVRYGIVTGLSKGRATITYTTIEGKRRANCSVYVVENKEKLKKEYQKVDDVETLSKNDIIVFGCPEKGLTASITRKDGYLVPVSTTFSSDKNKIVLLGEGSGEFWIDEGEYGFTLESQENKYLSGNHLKSVSFVNQYGSIDWAFEYIDDQPGVSPGNYVYSASESVDGWLMFNTKANRFTLYDSSVQVDMFLPTIYRLTVIFD